MPLFKKAAVNGRPLVQLSDVLLRVLRRCRMILIKDLNPTDILDAMTAEDGFKQDVKDAILSLWSPEKQVGAILDHLETQSDETFGNFMDILLEQYKHLHRVLQETARTLDETEDDQMRERAAIVGDSVRKLLRHTVLRQLQEQSRRGSNESQGDYYIDNLRNDADDMGQYIDCYIIPTRGKLQKEKWIKHVTSSKNQDTANVDPARLRKISEIVLAKDLTFRLINRSEIPESIAQPPKPCTCIYVVKQEEKEEKESVNDSRESAVEEKQTCSKVGRQERLSHPPPLPPKPDLLTLASRNLVKSGCATERKVKESYEVKVMPYPPLPVRKPQVQIDEINQATVHNKEAELPPTSEVTEQALLGNGTKSSIEMSEDDDDNNCTNSDANEDTELNFDVKIDDDDDDDDDDEQCEHVSTCEQRKQIMELIPGSAISRNRSNLSFTKFRAMPAPDSVLTASSLSPVAAVNSPDFQRSKWPDENVDEPMSRVHSTSLDQKVPISIFNSTESSHYEEIEPRGGSISSAAELYLDPRSSRSTIDQRGTRHKEYRNSTAAHVVSQLKNFQSPKEMTLAKGTLLIIKHKDEIIAQNTDFAHTFLGYDYMGFAYYLPVSAIRHYGDPKNMNWFYPIEMMAREATLFLSSVDQKGCFVVYRPAKQCESSPVYCLSVSLGNGEVVHYSIVENIHGDVMIQDHDHSFMNVCDLVEYFCKNQSNLTTRLRRSLKEANLPIMPDYHYGSQFEIPRHEIAVSSIIADRGTFGDYHLAAFKGISVKVAVMKTEASATNDDDFLEEALMMMMMMEHENVIRFLGVSCRSRPFYIVMENIDRGTLTECLQHNIIQSDNIDSLFAICIQLVAAMYYLESLSFMLHRNLATQSFFVTADLLVKLGKFDRARHVVDDNYQAPSSEEVMVRWAAPEVLTSSSYSTKSDVWSLGIVFWEVFSQGACPYSPLGVEQVAVYVTEGGKLDKPPGCALDLWSMMKSCWKQSPNDRPTFAMLQDKIKGKSSIYYVSPVRSNVSNKNMTVIDAARHSGFVSAKNKSNNLRATGSASKAAASGINKRSGSGSAGVRKKRSQSATRGLQDHIDRNEKEVREKRAASAVRNSSERARTPSSDSSSIVSASVMNDSCDDLDRGQKSTKSWKKLLK